MPQGSILGPLIFILYINRLPSVLQHTTPYLYADDTALVVTGESEDEIVHKMSNDLNQCSTWLNDHRLALNVGKTKLMFFGTAAKLSCVETTEIDFVNGTVFVVDEYKYLGMMLDCRLRFDKHVNYVRSKIIPKMKTLGKIRKFVNRSTSLYLYSSLIKPVFEYNDYI